jgi:hypothetical protein
MAASSAERQSNARPYPNSTNLVAAYSLRGSACYHTHVVIHDVSRLMLMHCVARSWQAHTAIVLVAVCFITVAIFDYAQRQSGWCALLLCGFVCMLQVVRGESRECNKSVQTTQQCSTAVRHSSATLHSTLRHEMLLVRYSTSFFIKVRTSLAVSAAAAATADNKDLTLESMLSDKCDVYLQSLSVYQNGLCDVSCVCAVCSLAMWSL